MPESRNVAIPLALPLLPERASGPHVTIAGSLKLFPKRGMPKDTI